MYVLIFGVFLLIVELLSMSFYILWYGIGLCISGAIGWMLGSENYIAQSVIGITIGAILMFLFRKKVLHKISQNKNKDEFLLVQGKGIISDNSLVEFRGTTWKYENETNDNFEIGEEVLVTPTKENKAFVEKIKK